MMDINIVLRNYIAGKATREQLRRQFTRENDAIDLLTKLVDACLQKTKPDVQGKRYKELNQDEIEVLILRLLTFRFKKADAHIFLQQIYHNPHFYEQLTPTLTVAATPYSEAISAPNDISLNNDTEIFAYLVKNQHQNKKQRKNNKILKWWRTLQHIVITWWSTNRRPTLVFASLLAVMLTVYSMWDSPGRHDIYKIYFAAETAYTSKELMSGATYHRLRGTVLNSEDQNNNADFSKLLCDVALAQDYYKYREFKKANTLFESLLSQITENEMRPEAAHVVRQYYFYAGMTYLALSGKKLSGKSDIKMAIQYLKRADELTYKQNGVHQDDILFFLSFCYSLIDDKITADAYQSQISKNSLFYNHSKEVKKD